MWPISQDARDALTRSHRVWARVDLLVAGVAVSSNIAVEDSLRLTVDGTATVRRQIQPSIAALAPFLPLDTSSLLAPFGNEIAVYSGVYLAPGAAGAAGATLDLPDGRVEYWPVGIFGIEDPELVNAGGLSLRINAYDRMLSLSERTLANTYTIADGTNTGAAIQALAAAVRPDITFIPADFSTVTSATTPLTVYNEGDDPAQRLQELAASCGCDVSFDPVGRLALAAVPDPDTTPVSWDYHDGAASVLESTDQVLSSRLARSHAIVRGEPVDGSPPVRADAYDDDPSSPTYYLGPFGDRPVTLATPLIKVQSQADEAAAAFLRRRKSAVVNVKFTAVAVTAHDADDAVHIGDTAASIDANFILESFTADLGPAATMEAVCKGRTL